MSQIRTAESYLRFWGTSLQPEDPRAIWYNSVSASFSQKPAGDLRLVTHPNAGVRKRRRIQRWRRAPEKMVSPTNLDANVAATKHLRCPVCSAAAAMRLIETIQDYSVFRCPNCDVEFSDPMKGAGHKFYETSPLYNEVRQVGFHIISYCQEQFLNRGKLGENLLEIGCATGTFLNGARKIGYQVSGIDFDRNSIQLARQLYGLEDVHALSVEEHIQACSKQKYDVVAFFEVLEHVEVPQTLLALVKKVLNPGGQIALSTPNRDRKFRKTRLDHLNVNQPPYYVDCPPIHLTRWTANSLKAFLEQQGFEIIELRPTPITWREIAFRLKSNGGFGLLQRMQAASPLQKSGLTAKPAMTRLTSILMRIKENAMKVAAIAMMPWIRLSQAQGIELYCIARLKKSDGY